MNLVSKKIQKSLENNSTQLDLSDLDLTSFPPELGNLLHLKKLNLSGNQLTSLPPEIGNLSNLEILLLGDNQLTSLPPEIKKLSNLETLSLYYNQFTSLPEFESGNLSKLKHLELGDNKLVHISSKIKNLSNLETLALYHNQLTTLPPEIGNLSGLLLLSLYRNQLTTLPPEIGNLSNLNTILLQNNQLTTLPPEIGNLSSLLVLSLYRNQLTTLPPEIGNLSNLNTILLQHNPLNSLPPEINIHLTRLDISNTNIAELPHNLFTQTLIADNTPFLAQMLEEAPTPGIAYEIHNAYDKIKDKLGPLYDIIDPTKTNSEPFPKMEDITTLFTNYINSDDYEASPESKANQIAELTMFMKKHMHDHEELDFILVKISPIVKYVMKQPKKFINYYIQTLIHDSFYSYTDVPSDAKFGDTIGCAKGIFERFILLIGDTTYAMCPSEPTCIIPESDPETRDQYHKISVIFGKVKVDDSDVTKDWARSVMKGKQSGLDKNSTGDKLEENLKDFLIAKYKSLYLISDNNPPTAEDQIQLTHISEYVAGVRSMITDFLNEEYLGGFGRRRRKTVRKYRNKKRQTIRNGQKGRRTGGNKSKRRQYKYHRVGRKTRWL